ncbi:MAG: DUF4184 family protein [bacterium]
MPFTFSHPAAILPLRKLCPRFLHFEALFLGSISPDLGYFFFRFREARFAHTAAGSLLLDVPCGMLLYFVLKSLWKFRTGKALPSSLFRPRLLLKLALSILIGAWSHILWDAFTHQTGIFGSLPWVNTTHVIWLDRRLPLYELLHLFSSVIGLFFVSHFFWKLWKGAMIRYFRTHRCFVTLCLLLPGAFGFLRTREFHDLSPAIFYFLIYAIDGTAILILFKVIFPGFRGKVLHTASLENFPSSSRFFPKNIKKSETS